MVSIKTDIFNHFYSRHLVLLNMVPRTKTTDRSGVARASGSMDGVKTARSRISCDRDFEAPSHESLSQSRVCLCNPAGCGQLRVVAEGERKKTAIILLRLRIGCIQQCCMQHCCSAPAAKCCWCCWCCWCWCWCCVEFVGRRCCLDLEYVDATLR